MCIPFPVWSCVLSVLSFVYLSFITMLSIQSVLRKQGAERVEGGRRHIGAWTSAGLRMFREAAKKSVSEYKQERILRVVNVWNDWQEANMDTNYTPVKLEPGGSLPLELLEDFLEYCLLNVEGLPMFKLTTVRGVYLPDLLVYMKTNNISCTEQDNLLELREHLQKHISGMLRNKQIPAKSLPRVEDDGCEPCLSFDVHNMLATLPLGSSYYDEICAFTQLGFETGHRGVTLVSIVWENIEVTYMEDDYCSLLLNFTDSKGVMKGSLTCTCDGSVSDLDRKPFVYRLEQLLKFRMKDWNLTLKDLPTLNLTGKLFPRKKDRYSARLHTIGLMCGLPFMSSHCLRSGHLVESLIRAVREGGSIHDSWTMCALLQHWSPREDSAMIKYIKVSKSCKICSDYDFYFVLLVIICYLYHFNNCRQPFIECSVAPIWWAVAKVAVLTTS